MNLPLIVQGMGGNSVQRILPSSLSNQASEETINLAISGLSALVESFALPPAPIAVPCRDLTPPSPPPPLSEKARKYLQRYGFDLKDINKASKDGYFPLNFAVTLKNRDLVRSLVASGADLYQLDRHKHTAFDSALLMDNLDMALFLKEEMGFDVNKSNYKNTFLIESIRSGKIDRVRFIIELGADVNYAENYMTPLIEAVQQDNCEMVKLLVEKGANIDQIGIDFFSMSHTALIEAIYRNQLSMVNCLIKLKADINKGNGNGLTPLLVAILNGNLEIVYMLKKSGVIIDPFMISHILKSALLNNNFKSLKCIDFLGLKIVTASDKQDILEAEEWSKRSKYQLIYLGENEFFNSIALNVISGNHENVASLQQLMADTEYMKKAYERSQLGSNRLLNPVLAASEKPAVLRRNIHYQVPEICRDPCEGAHLRISRYNFFNQLLIQEFENVFGSPPRLSGFKVVDDEVDYGSPALERGLELSRTIVTHMNHLFKYSSNYPKRSKGENVNFRQLHDVTKYVQKGKTELESISRMISYGEGNWVGNCGDMSLAGMQFQAHNNDGLSVERYLLNKGDHAFLVVGRDPKTNPFDPSKWNPEAVICDPWAIAYYPARRYKDYLAGYAGLLVQGSPEESDSYSPVIDPLENVMHRGLIWISPLRSAGEQYPIKASLDEGERPSAPTPIKKKAEEAIAMPVNSPKTPKLDFLEVMAQVNQMILSYSIR